MKSNRGSPFLAIGIVFLYIGMAGRSAFIGLGVAFLAIGLGLIGRERKRGSAA
jgi:hypothetical protein